MESHIFQETTSSLSSTVNYKVIIIGNSSVGKTSILRRLQYGPTSTDLHLDAVSATVGVDLQTHRVKLSNGLNVNLQIWDTAGQERFHRITLQYYRGAHAVIFVYDITNRQSFHDINRWMRLVNDFNGLSVTDDKAPRSPNRPVFALFGNKIDKIDEVAVPQDEGFQLHDRYNMSAFFETSAVDGQQVEEAFQRLAFCLVDNWDYVLLTKCFNETKKPLIDKNSVIDTEKMKPRCKDPNLNDTLTLPTYRPRTAAKDGNNLDETSSCFRITRNQDDNCLLL